MNKQRKTRLVKVYEQILKAKEDIEAIRDEEQEAFDNLPEGLQDSERGEQMEGYVLAMEDAATSLEEAIDDLDAVLI